MDLIKELREKLQKLLEQRDAHQKDLNELVAAPMAEDRSAETRGAFTEDEETRFGELRTAITGIDEQIAPLQERIGQLEEAAESERRAADARQRFGLDASQVTVRSEERTYRRGGEHRYFQDLAACAVPGLTPAYVGAQERLARHAREVEVEAREHPDSITARSLSQVSSRMGSDPDMRDLEARTGLTTAVGSGGTFLPPAYLLDEYVKYPRQLRVLADLVRKQDLPKGPMTIEIPKIASATAVSAQATQNTDATETDLTDEYVTAAVETVAGQQTVSLQAIEQSSVPFDEIVFDDLNMSLDNTMETYVVNGSGSSGQFTGVLNTSSIGAVTYTDSSPTQVEAWPYLGKAKATVYDALFRPAQAILMTPDRWAWFEAGQDSQGRPLVLPASNGPFNAAGLVDGELSNGPVPVGRIFGLPVYVTAAIPTDLGSGTNQDEVIVVSTVDLYLWESTPVARALPQTLGNQLSVLLQVYEYAAFMPNRLPGAICTVGGTGLTTPSF